MKYLSIILMMVAFLSCNGRRSATASDGDAVELRYVSLLQMYENEGYTDVIIRNPWDTTKMLRRYLLVPRDADLPTSLPEGTIVRTPLSKALIYSSIHAGLLRELNAVDAIGGVCSKEYMKDSVVSARIEADRIIDCGNNMNPDVERILQLRPDAILASPYQNGDSYGKAGALGIPVIECADYMEPSALGRAEWVRFYGRLFGRAEEADKMFATTESEYLRLKDLAKQSKENPKVIIDQRYGQTWDVPGGNSTTGLLISDAGGTNPFANFKQNGSISLSPEKVLATAHDADVWLVRYYQTSEKTLSELAADSPVNSQFNAFKEGNVYGSNTMRNNLYEETPFHPDRLLRDLVIIFHPGALGNMQTKYYKKMK